MAGDLDAGEDQNPAEDEQQPVESLQQGHPGEDEDGSHHQGSEDAPEEDPELVLRGDGEVGEEHRPDEHVVDGEALLDQVASQVLPGGLTSLPPEQDEDEPESEGNPGGALYRRLPEGDDVGSAVDDQQVHQEEHDDHAQHRRPHPRRYVEGGELDARVRFYCQPRHRWCMYPRRVGRKQVRFPELTRSWSGHPRISQPGDEG